MTDGDYCSGQSLEHPGDQVGVSLVPAEQTGGSDSNPDQTEGRRTEASRLRHSVFSTNYTNKKVWRAEKRPSGSAAQSGGGGTVERSSDGGGRRPPATSSNWFWSVSLVRLRGTGVTAQVSPGRRRLDSSGTCC